MENIQHTIFHVQFTIDHWLLNIECRIFFVFLIAELLANHQAIKTTVQDTNTNAAKLWV
jgi:hypothetical protein